MNEEDDPLDALLKRLSRNRGDQEAWEKLYQRMWGFVVAIVIRTIRDEPPEDTAQEVFVRVARYCPFPRLQTGDSFRAYLWRVARNYCYSRLSREQRSLRPTSLSDGPEQAVDPARDFEWRELYDWVTEELSLVDQEILRLTDEGFSPEEIAKTLGTSANNVRVRRHRARVVVRKLMIENGLIR